MYLNDQIYLSVVLLKATPRNFSPVVVRASRREGMITGDLFSLYQKNILVLFIFGILILILIF